MLINFTLVVCMTAALGGRMTWNLLWLPVLGLCLVANVVAFGLPLSALTVYYHDFQYAVPLGVQVWLFASPVAYSATVVDGSMRWIYPLVNPVVGPIESIRRVAAYGVGPDFTALGLSMASTLVVLVGGYVVFRACEPSLVDRV